MSNSVNSKNSETKKNQWSCENIPRIISSSCSNYGIWKWELPKIQVCRFMYLHSDLEQWKSGEFPGWQKMCEIQVENIFSNFKVHWKILVCHLTKIFALWPGKGKKIVNFQTEYLTDDKRQKKENWKNIFDWKIGNERWDTIFWIDFPHNSEVNFPLNCK